MDINKAEKRLIIAKKLYPLIVKEAQLPYDMQEELEDHLFSREKEISLYKKKLDSIKPHKSLKTDYRLHIKYPTEKQFGKIILTRPGKKYKLPILKKSAPFAFLFILAKEFENDLGNETIKPADIGWRSIEDIKIMGEGMGYFWGGETGGTFKGLVAEVRKLIIREIKDRYNEDIDTQLKEKLYHIIEHKAGRCRLSVRHVEAE